MGSALITIQKYPVQVPAIKYISLLNAYIAPILYYDLYQNNSWAEGSDVKIGCLLCFWSYILVDEYRFF